MLAGGAGIKDCCVDRTFRALLGSLLQCRQPHAQCPRPEEPACALYWSSIPRTDASFVQFVARTDRRSVGGRSDGPRDAAPGALPGGNGPRSLVVERADDRLVCLSRRSLDVDGVTRQEERGRVGTSGRLPGNGREHRPGRREIERIETAKAKLDPADPEARCLSARAEELAEQLHHKTLAEQDLAETRRGRLGRQTEHLVTSRSNSRYTCQSEPVLGPVGMCGFDRAWLPGNASRGCCSGLVNQAAKRSTWQPPVDSRPRCLGSKVSVEATSAPRVVEASFSGAAIRTSVT